MIRYGDEKAVSNTQKGLHCYSSESSVCALLSKIKHSSPGKDDIVCGLINCLLMTEVGVVVSKIFNTSVAKGFVPDAWKHAIVTHVPKCYPAYCK